MVSSVSALPRALRVSSSRRRERGAAVFIVVLVIVMLTGIGVFAARAATLSIHATGFERQMTQTHYITEYGMLSVTGEMATPRKEAYVKQMSKTPDLACKSADKIKSVFTCYRFGVQDIEKQIKVDRPGVEFVVPAIAGAKPEDDIPGSLGSSDLDASFLVEMSDLGPASPPVAGSDLTSAGAANVVFMAVTLRGIGMVRPAGNTAGTVDMSTSIETARSHIVVGPIPKL